MSRTHRVLPAEPFTSLQAYLDAGGGKGLAAAQAVEASVVIDELAASGLRGRGGAGFPTAVKWATVSSYASDILSTSVIVNAAEGEPGTFKDRSILRANPYAVLEGAVIAALVVEARSITIATKHRFADEVARLRGAIAEITDAGWLGDIEVDVVEGPGEYLYGEETALLEVLDGRPPFPRIAPPFRRGVVEVVEGDADVSSGSGLSADVEMAGSDGATVAPPVLVNNVETIANVPGIIANGAAWFREHGTEDSPGTIVCTVTGGVRRPGVGEMALGTPLRDVLQEIGGGPVSGRQIIAVLSGVSNAIITPEMLDTPITYEALRAAGSGLGSASFIVVDDRTAPAALAAGVSRFLAVESCGQCTPCKTDGLQIASVLERLCSGQGHSDDLRLLTKRIGTVADGARCSLAGQHATVVGSIMDRFASDFELQDERGAHPVAPFPIAELNELGGGAAVVDPTFAQKRSDWTYGSGEAVETPVDRLSDHRAGHGLADLER
jgi:NADH-quinone oxidoreductase subunit F